MFRLMTESLRIDKLAFGNRDIVTPGFSSRQLTATERSPTTTKSNPNDRCEPSEFLALHIFQPCLSARETGG
jgi:hypothetical protein